jgi:exosortase/archaeosortase family protein
MKRFIALYFLFLAILFTFFYADTSAMSTFLNDGQTKLTLFGLDLFLKPEQLKGIDIWINPHYKIIINKACNGVIPILFLYASILAYPSNVGHKILWMLLGYVLFSVVNVLRILLVVYVTEAGKGQEDFYWSHDLMGNTLLMLTGLGLFIAFIKTSSKTINTIKQN